MKEMVMFRWLREWRAWVVFQKLERERRLIVIIRGEFAKADSPLTDYGAKLLIDTVRSFDKGNYEPLPF